MATYGNAFDVFGGQQIATDLSAWFDTAAVKNSDNSFTTDKTDLSVSLNAAEAATPSTSAPRQGFSDFWQGIANTVVGYAIQKDAAQSGLTTTGGRLQQGATNGATTQTPVQQARGFSPLAVGALLLGAYMLAKRA